MFNMYYVREGMRVYLNPFIFVKRRIDKKERKNFPVIEYRDEVGRLIEPIKRLLTRSRLL